jgi:cytoskeletal protein RodZ
MSDQGEQLVVSVGGKFRQAREKRGIELEEVSRITRIGRSYLQAIESDSFDKLPSAAHARGFIRAYATFLGLSGNELVVLYDQTTAPPPPTLIPRLPLDDRSFAARLSGSLSADRRRWLFPLIIVIPLLLIVILFNQGEEQNQPTAENVPSALPSPVQPKITSATKPHAEPVSTPPATPLPNIPVKVVPPQTFATPPAGAKRALLLRIRVIEETPLSITVDGVLSKEYLLRVGDVIEWKGERSFALELENAGGVEAELNGRRLAPFGPHGEARRVLLKSDSK